jgi:hypothetical protein
MAWAMAAPMAVVSAHTELPVQATHPPGDPPPAKVRRLEGLRLHSYRKIGNCGLGMMEH